MKTTILTITTCVMLSPSLLAAADLQAIPAEEATKWGARFAELASKLENPQVKIQADAEKANGVHVPDKVGFMLVPQKDLQESEELSAKFRTESGAALAYLFMYHAVPVSDGQGVDTGRIRSVSLTDDEGNEHKIYVLLLAVRRLDDGDYRLYGYGQEKQPVVDAQFSQAEATGAEPVAVAVQDADQETHEGTVVVTVFGKYQASFRATYTEE